MNDVMQWWKDLDPTAKWVIVLVLLTGIVLVWQPWKRFSSGGSGGGITVIPGTAVAAGAPVTGTDTSAQANVLAGEIQQLSSQQQKLVQQQTQLSQQVAQAQAALGTVQSGESQLSQHYQELAQAEEFLAQQYSAETANIGLLGQLNNWRTPTTKQIVQYAQQLYPQGVVPGTIPAGVQVTPLQA